MDKKQLFTRKGGKKENSSPLNLSSFLLKSPELIKRRLLWYIIFKLTAITSSFIVILLLTLLPTKEKTFLPFGEITSFPFHLLATFYVVQILNLIIYKLLPYQLGLQSVFQLVTDLAFISGLVYYFGGITSPFSILYIIIISVSLVLFHKRGVITLSIVAFLFYLAVVLGIQLNIFPKTPFHSEVSTPRLAYNLITHFIAFLATAYLGLIILHTEEEIEEALEQSALYIADLQVAYQDILQSIPSGIIITDMAGTITSMNSSAKQILKMSDTTFIGSKITELGFLDSQEWDKITQLQQKSKTKELARGESRILIEDKWRWIGYVVSTLRTAKEIPRGFVIVFQDLTRWKEMQEELKIKDRLATAGELAARLAHEIGNPLTAISGASQLLQESSLQEEASKKLLTIITRETKRLERIIKDFLKLSKTKTFTPSLIDIPQLLRDQIYLLRKSEDIKEHHIVIGEISPEHLTISADGDKISQLFWNLAKNALRAMKDGGTLSITSYVEGNRYVIQFADTGKGMTEEEKQNIFRPFKTFFDEGTGIGMAIVYNIVKDHQGEIEIESEEGKGTKITVYLPINNDEHYTSS